MAALIKPEEETTQDPQEIGSLARQLSAAFVRARDAEIKDSKDWSLRHPRSDPLELMETRPESIGWHDIAFAEEAEPGSAAVILERLRREARSELKSGSRAAYAVAAELGPWARIRFQELRESFIEEYQPQGGIQMRMIEMLAQTYTAYELWMSFHPAANIEFDSCQLYGTVFDRFERAAAMADRFLRLFLRVQRHLRDLRRYAVPLTINNARQVNIAAEGGQQVNLQASEQ
jgi:hypothetical protein